MLPDSQKRVKEIRKTSEVFRGGGYHKTSMLMDSIADAVKVKQFSDIDDKFIKMTTTFGEEFYGQDDKLAKLFNFILKTLLEPVYLDKNKFRSKLNELNPWRELYKKKVDTLSKFAQQQSISKASSQDLAFVNLCIVYGLMCEGLFDEGIRFVDILVNMSNGIDMKYEDIQNKFIHDMRSDLKKLTNSDSEILFSGYNSHLRNAIFHFNFYYDKSSGKMHFQDFSGKRKTYDEEISFDQFKRLYVLLDAVDDLILMDLLILWISDMIYSPKPFDS